MSTFKGGRWLQRTNSTVSSGGTLTLVNNSARYQRITGTSAHTIQLPVATTMFDGQSFVISNRGTGAVTVNYSDSSLAATLAANTQKTFFLNDNSTADGTWDISNEANSGGGASLSTGDKLSILSALSNQNYQDSSGSIAQKIYFNPEEIGVDSFITRSSLLFSVISSPAPFTLNGFMYACGGYTGSAVASVAYFNDDDNYWLARQSMTNSRYFAASYALNGVGYVAGGQTGGNTGLSFNELYSDALNTWTTKTALTNPSTNAFAFAFDYGYVAGGTDGSASVVTTNQQYDDANNAWTSRQPLLTVQSYAQGGQLNDYGYAVTGENGGGAVAIVQRFNRQSDFWTNVASANTTGSRALASSVGPFLYKFGGNANNTRTEEYVDTANFWRNKSNIPTGVASSYAGTVNGFGYLLGDSATVGVQKYSNTCYVYVASVKRSKLLPSALIVSAALKDLAVNVPFQVRTDGDNWKTLTANVDSSIKNGETVPTKFREFGMTYVYGGSDGSNNSIASSEFYSPLSNTWTTRGSSSTARANPLSFAVNGLGIVAGGANPTAASSANATAEQYNEITNVFAGVAAMPSATQEGIGYNLVETGYVVAGRTSSGVATAQNINYGFNQILNSWSVLTVLPASLTDVSGWALMDKGYVAGGADASNTYQNSLYAYNPISNAWATLATAPSIDAGCTGFAFNTYGYRVDGINNNNTVYKYDQNANSWSTVASTNNSHRHGAGNSSGGFGYAYCSQSVDTTFESYDDASNIWTNKTSMNTARYKPGGNYTPGIYRNYELRVGVPAYVAGAGGGVWVTGAVPITARSAAAGFTIGNYMYAAGGNGPLSSSERYSFASNSWKSTVPLTNAVASLDCGNTGLLGFGYAISGTTGSSVAVTFNQKFDPELMVVSSAAAAPQEYASMACVLNGLIYAFGGSNNGGASSTQSTFSYNPTTNVWSSNLVNLSVAKANASGASLNGFAYCIGGFGVSATAVVEKLNDVSDVWTTVTSYPTTIYNLFATTLNGTIVVAGGSPSGSASTATNAYNDNLNLWIAKNSILTAVYSPAAGVINDSLILSSGNSGSSDLQIMQMYTSSLKNFVLGTGLRVTES